MSKRSSDAAENAPNASNKAVCATRVVDYPDSDLDRDDDTLVEEPPVAPALAPVVVDGVVWRSAAPIGFPEYAATRVGGERVVRIDKNLRLTPTRGMVTLCGAPGSRKISVARLVRILFDGEPAERPAKARPLVGSPSTPVERVNADGTVDWYASIADAARLTRTGRTSIAMVCKGAKPSIAGKVWRLGGPRPANGAAPAGADPWVAVARAGEHGVAAAAAAPARDDESGFASDTDSFVVPDISDDDDLRFVVPSDDDTPQDPARRPIARRIIAFSDSDSDDESEHSSQAHEALVGEVLRDEERSVDSSQSDDSDSFVVPDDDDRPLRSHVSDESGDDDDESFVASEADDAAPALSEDEADDSSAESAAAPPLKLLWRVRDPRRRGRYVFAPPGYAFVPAKLSLKNR